MRFDPRSDVETRIERAMRQYADPDSEMTVEDLEREIDRAFWMEYDHDELPVMISGSPVQSWSLNADRNARAIRVLGMNVEPGSSVRFDRVMDAPDPFEIEIDPWEDETSDDDGFLASLKDWFYSDPAYVDSNRMVVRGDVEFDRIDGDGMTQLHDGEVVITEDG
jgi:hypothetical protein